MKKKGFTLIELLAVIVVLAIIALIATPIVMNLIKNAQDSSLVRSADSYLDSVDLALANRLLKNKPVVDGTYPITADGSICMGAITDSLCDDEMKAEVNGTKPIAGNVTVANGKVIDSLIEFEDGTMVMGIGSSLAIQKDKYLAAAILKNNNEESDVNIKFNEISSSTNGKGLYYTSNNTENSLPTYYFRGDVNNNYVKFAKDAQGNDLYWRIVRINEDGSVRLIYSGTSVTATGDAVTIGSSKFNKKSADNAHVGYMYGLPEIGTVFGDLNKDAVLNNADYTMLENYVKNGVKYTNDPAFLELLSDMNFDGKIDNADLDLMKSVLLGETTYSMSDFSDAQRYNSAHKNSINSALKTFIDNWYEDNLISYSSYLADAGFCSDRSIATSAGEWDESDTALGYGNNKTYYGAHNRLYNLHQPQFGCSNADRDLFTTSTSDKGNKALSYPIGTITADEVSYAGAIYGVDNTEYYLRTGAHYWTMSPRNFRSNGAYEWITISYGYQDYYPVNNSYGVRPVINLKADVEIELTGTGDAGTPTNPYIVKTN